MSLAYALTFFCDAMLYYAALGCMGLLRACREDIFWVPILLLAACWLSGRLLGRGRWWLRWTPMAALPLCLVLASNLPGRILSLPMLVYLPLYIWNNRRAPDYDYAADRFRYSLIVAGLALFLSLIFHAASWKRGLPYLFLYFTLNVTLLRLLRHDDRIARSRRFRALNLGGVALVCAAGFGLSQPGIVAALGAAWRWFADNVLLNLLALVFYIVQLALYGLSWLLARFLGSGGFEPAEMPRLNSGTEPYLPAAAEEIRALPPAVRLLLQAIGIAALAALVFVVLRALSRRMARAELSAGADERESLDADAPPRHRAPRLRRDPEDGVRHQYRRALALVRARGGRVTPTMNTLQIQRENASAVDEDAMAALREIYLPVRYGGREATREDVARARRACEDMRKGGKRHVEL